MGVHDWHYRRIPTLVLAVMQGWVAQGMVLREQGARRMGLQAQKVGAYWLIGTVEVVQGKGSPIASDITTRPMKVMSHSHPSRRHQTTKPTRNSQESSRQHCALASTRTTTGSPHVISMAQLELRDFPTLAMPR